MGLREEHTLSGSLDNYYEQGMEYGVGILSLPNQKKSIHWFEDGDLLTIFNNRAKKEIVWQGELTLQEQKHEMPVPKGMSKRGWSEMLLTEMAADVLPRKYVKKVKEQETNEQKELEQKKRETIEQKQSIQHRAMRNYLDKRK